MSLNYNRFLGYTRDEEGKLVIVPEEAETVKRIFREYLEGGSTTEIAAGLEADGILTGANRMKGYGTTVDKILRNEKYIGDAVLQKTYTVDFLEKKRAKNDSLIPQYYAEGSHEAIISDQIFMEVQAEIARRAASRTDTKNKSSYFSKYAFSEIAFCVECGSPYRRLTWTTSVGLFGFLASSGNIMGGIWQAVIIIGPSTLIYTLFVIASNRQEAA